MPPPFCACGSRVGESCGLLSSCLLTCEVPRGLYAEGSCECPIFTQYGLICASPVADKEEAGRIVEKSDIDRCDYLDRDLLKDNPILLTSEPVKVVNSRGRPSNTYTFSKDKPSLFDQATNQRARAIISNHTASNTTNLGKKAGDRSGRTSASV